MARKPQRRSRHRDDQVPSVVVNALAAKEDYKDTSDEQGLCEGLISALLAADRCKASSAYCCGFAAATVAVDVI